MWGDVGRCGEMWGGYGEIRGDTAERRSCARSGQRSAPCRTFFSIERERSAAARSMCLRRERAQSQGLERGLAPCMPSTA